MKRIIIPFLFLLITGTVLASGPLPYPIFGIITVGEERVNAMDISFENIGTGYKITKTVMNGEIVIDRSEIGNADKVKVTYCISDSRCNSFSNTFTVSGVSLNIGTNIESAPGGLSGPYSIYGHIYQDGVLLKNVKIKVEDVTKGYSEDLETNEAGEYVLNLANLGIYDTGDTIKISYGTHYAIGYVKGAGLQLDLSISTAEGGNGGGGGGNGGTTEPEEQEKPDETEPGEVKPGEEDEVIIPDNEEGVITQPGGDFNGWIIAGILFVILAVLGALIWYFNRNN